jgi:DNA modification methylase
MVVNSTMPGEVVLDPFGGSGSTLLACEVSRRRAALVELVPRFCDVTVARWERLTGKTAALVRN